MKEIKQIIKEAIDVHVHVGPEPIPRRFTAASIAAAERSNIAGMVLKNHFYPTQPLINQVPKGKMRLFGSITLNNSVGGLNAEAVYASCSISDVPIVVWFPTIDSKNFLGKSEFEVPPEWVGRRGFKSRRSSTIEPVLVTEENKLTERAMGVLRVIRDNELVLATGHISSDESELLIRQALRMGIRKIIVTHPIYQRIGMPLSVQQRLAKMGCFIEQCFSMYSIDGIPIRRIAEQIKALDKSRVVLSSDTGQQFGPKPSEALAEFSRLLMKCGIPEEDLYKMLVENPRRLLGADSIQ
jgi:hypothetical protein